jgi:molybdopterin/thiamine biosynthesis adenylyltransferase
MQKDYWRQLDFYKPNGENVLVVGAGSIGSYTTFGLLRMGVPSVTVVDFDIVEPHNIPNQFFMENDSLYGGDIPKVDVLKKTIHAMINMKEQNLTTIYKKIENYLEEDYVNLNNFAAIIVTVDSMAVRKWIYDYVQHLHQTGRLSKGMPMIDARVGGEYADIYSFRHSDYAGCAYYNSTLYTDAESVDLPCSGQSIIDTSFCVAGQIIQRYRHMASDSVVPTHTMHDFKTGQAYIMIGLIADSPEITEKLINLEKENIIHDDNNTN